MREDYWSEEYEQDSTFQQHKEVNKKMKGRNNTPNTFKTKTLYRDWETDRKSVV